MTMKHVSVAQAKNTLPSLLREAELEPIEIRRNDTPAGVLLSVETYRRLAAKERRRTALAALETLRAAGGLPRIKRDRSSGRTVELP